MRRALRYDGVLPVVFNSKGRPEVGANTTPADIKAIKTFIDEQCTWRVPFDIAMEVEMPDDHEQAVAIVRPLAEAGVTWLVEDVYHRLSHEEGKVRWERRGLEGMRTHINQGPPRID